MDKKQVLELIKSALLTIKKDPTSVEAVEKNLSKDDMPHAPNTPEDKAHDVIEEDESIKQALAILDTPEKRAKMLEHLRSLSDESQQRSPENQDAGQELIEKAVPSDIKSSRRKAALKEKAARGLPKYKDMGTHQSPDNPHAGHKYGINPQSSSDKQGVSVMGHHIRSKSDPVIPLKEQAKDKIQYLKEASKPNLPKSELEKEETKHDRCARKVKEANPEIKNPHAVCVSVGVKPSKWKKSEMIKNELKKEWKPKFKKGCK